jgi:hypothetical protein
MGFKKIFKEGLDTILYEFNPLNDYKQFTFQDYSNKPLNEGMQILLKNHEFIIHSYKPILRGLTVGAIAGLAHSYINDTSLESSILKETALFMTIDFFTYLIRGHIKNISVYFKNSSN